MRLAGVVVRASCLPFLVRSLVQRRRVTMLVYHDPAPGTFAAHLRALSRAYSVVSLRKAVEALRRGDLRSLPRKPLVVTLDDGHRGNVALLPVLEEVGVPVTVFLCADLGGPSGAFWFRRADAAALKRLPDGDRLAILERCPDDRERDALAADEVRALARVVDFQSHTRTHPILPMCDDAKAAEEIAGAREALRERFGFDVFAIAYPNGDYSERDVELVRHAGYGFGLTVDPGFNTPSTDPFRLRRIPIGDEDDVSTVIVKASGIWTFVKWRLRERTYGERRHARPPLAQGGVS